MIYYKIYIFIWLSLIIYAYSETREQMAVKNDIIITWTRQASKWVWHQLQKSSAGQTRDSHAISIQPGNREWDLQLLVFKTRQGACKTQHQDTNTTTFSSSSNQFFYSWRIPAISINWIRKSGFEIFIFSPYLFYCGGTPYKSHHQSHGSSTVQVTATKKAVIEKMSLCTVIQYFK